MKCNVSDKLYIDRTAAIMTAMDYDGNGNAQDASQDIASALSALPAADVRPVVRCINCIRLAKGTCPVQLLKSDESFCSWGADMRENEPQKCEDCHYGCHWDSVVICFKDGQRHERNKTCKEG